MAKTVCGWPLQTPRVLEALAGPDCGWFYRANASGFDAIPGSPIAYWASSAMLKAFNSGKTLDSVSTIKQGMKTADNETFLRFGKKFHSPELDAKMLEVSINMTDRYGFRI